jgi:hypothetical protein
MVEPTRFIVIKAPLTNTIVKGTLMTGRSLVSCLTDFSMFFGFWTFTWKLQARIFFFYFFFPKDVCPNDLIFEPNICL